MPNPELSAVVITEQGKAEVRKFPSRELRPHEVRVANTLTAMSYGTEYLVLSGQLHGCTFPCLLGYQGVGRIVELGPDVEGYAIGDRVCSGLSIYQPEGYGMGSGNGHMSHPIVSDKGDFGQSALVRIPAEVSDEEAAYAWLGSVGMLGVMMANVREGENVAVVGLGIVGQFVAQICRARKARVYACDLSPDRVKLAREYSADVVAGDVATLNELLRADHPEGASVVMECTGNTKVLDSSLDLAAPDGRVVLQGHYPGQVSFRFIVSHMKRLRFFCPCGWGDLQPAIRLMQEKKMIIRPWVQKIFQPNEVPELYARLYRRDPELTSALIRWS